MFKNQRKCLSVILSYLSYVCLILFLRGNWRTNKDIFCNHEVRDLPQASLIWQLPFRACKQAYFCGSRRQYCLLVRAQVNLLACLNLSMSLPRGWPARGMGLAWIEWWISVSCNLKSSKWTWGFCVATPNADVWKHYRKRSFNVQLNALDAVKALLQTRLLKQAFCTYISLCTNAPSPRHFLRGGGRLYTGYTYIYASFLLLSVRFLFFV